MVRNVKLALLASVIAPLFLFGALFFAPPTKAAFATGVGSGLGIVVAPPQSTGQTSTDLFPEMTKAIQESMDTHTLNMTVIGGGTKALNLKTGEVSPGGIPDAIAQWLGMNLLGSGNQGSTSTAQGGIYYPGAIGGALNMTSIALTNPPASSREYVADLINNFQSPLGVKPAYAQGIGFSSLSTVLELWKLFRDLAYLFFVIIFLVVGFLIMFRAKIGSQTAVTVQQMLPKLVVSLILVTFSYAIAGFLLDAMYLMIYLLIGVFALLSGKYGAGFSFQQLQNVAFTQNIFTNGLNTIGGVAGSVAGSVNEIVANFLSAGTVTAGANPDIVSKALGGASAIVALLVVAVAILFAVFRTFFILLKAYVSILFSVILAPIQLLLGALPGQNAFSKWINNLIENIIVFPVVIFMLFMVQFFSAQSKAPTIGGFTAPQLGSGVAAGAGAFSSLIALGVILAMPEAAKIAKGILKGDVGVGVGDLTKNLAAGWKGGELIPGIGLSKIPGVGNITSETNPERLIMGKRDYRAKERQYTREIYDKTGKDLEEKRGGLVGLLTNKGVGARNAAKGGGSPGSGGI